MKANDSQYGYGSKSGRDSDHVSEENTQKYLPYTLYTFYIKCFMKMIKLICPVISECQR